MLHQCNYLKCGVHKHQKSYGLLIVSLFYGEGVGIDPAAELPNEQKPPAISADIAKSFKPFCAP